MKDQHSQNKSHNKQTRILGIIPARGGSKRLPGKNTMPLNGRSLLARVYDAAKQSQYLTDILLSSDDDTILEHGRTIGMEVVKRPDALATDEATSAIVIEHLLPELQAQGKHYDYVVLMQATSPLVQTDDIDQCIEKAFKSNVQNCITTYPEPNSQTGLYPPNGAAYAISIQQFAKHTEVTIPGYDAHRMPQERCIDIDTQEDFNAAQEYLKAIES